MRKSYLILFLFTVVFFACEDEQALDMAEKNTVEFHGKKAIIHSKNLSHLRIKNLPGSIVMDEAIPKGEIRIEASEELNSDLLEVKSDGGELRIEGKGGAPLTIELEYYINPLEVTSIVVEGDNKIFITATPVLDYLELITQGASELIIHNLKVKNLVSRREGKSRMFLSSELTGFKGDSIYFADSVVRILDEQHLIYTEEEVDYLLFAPEIQIRDDSVFALGYDDPLKSYFVTQTHELRNEGESFLNALTLPSRVISSKNEGESESKVWAIDQLNVKGEGASIMSYFAGPEVDAQLTGSSRLKEL